MERVSRRSFLAAGSSAAIAGAVIGGGVAAAQATRPPGQPLLQWLERYILVNDAARSGTARTAPSATSVPTGPAYFTGAIYKDGDVGASGPASGAGAVGTFRLSVWVYAGGTTPASVGTGTIDLAGRGKVVLAGGGGPAGSFAVIGGTGEFAHAGGEARVAYLTAGNAAQTILELDMVPESVGR